ncbi:MAG: adenosyl-hopene transferase HpnH [Verrucomicrobiae bacterium]|nr:adenosyl-hopene transferase HpnH [Verrucomicrobiae bacterium]
MRFPFAIAAKIARHIIRHKLKGTEKFALVLQLEPLHACNLSCTGCGRIREYPATLQQMMSLQDCLAAAAECDAPMVSICGGEPTIYPHLEELVQGLLRQGRIVHVCTNSARMRQKLSNWLAHSYRPALEPKLTKLVADGLLTEKDAAEIRNGTRNDRPVISPSKRFYWNVHLDGLERTHDLVVERPGVFRECIAAIRLAKALGFQVATNTTVYKETDMREIEQLFDFLSSLGVDGFTISPGYDYDAAKLDMIQRGKAKPEDFFLTRKLTREKFAHIVEWGRKYPLLGTPAYLEFLAGLRELHCTAWAIPTRNISGWRSPCYMMADAHYPTYREMLEKTDWNRYGVFNGKARDPRCENCMTHCGYEPTASLCLNRQRGDIWKLIRYNFGPRPKPISNTPHLNPVNAAPAAPAQNTPSYDTR